MVHAARGVRSQQKSCASTDAVRPDVVQAIAPEDLDIVLQRMAPLAGGWWVRFGAYNPHANLVVRPCDLESALEVGWPGESPSTGCRVRHYWM